MILAKSITVLLCPNMMKKGKVKKMKMMMRGRRRGR